MGREWMGVELGVSLEKAWFFSLLLDMGGMQRPGFSCVRENRMRKVGRGGGEVLLLGVSGLEEGMGRGGGEGRKECEWEENKNSANIWESEKKCRLRRMLTEKY